MTRSGTAVGVLGWLAVLAAAAAVSAQPPRPVARVGILNSGTAQDARVAYFVDELRKLGYAEGQTSASSSAEPKGARSAFRRWLPSWRRATST